MIIPVRLLTLFSAAALSLFGSLTPHMAVPRVLPCLSSAHSRCYAPSELRALYEADPLYASGVTGRGETIAVIVSYGDPALRRDVATFDRTFHLPQPALRVEAPLGRARARDQGWVVETALDVEWAHVMAPGARIVVFESPVDETEGTQGLPQFLTLEKDAVRQGAAVVNQSWGATEQTLFGRAGRALVKRFDAFYASASRHGVSFTTGSGDDGAAGLDDSLKHYYPYRVAQWPASNPHVLAVGGTRIESLSPPSEVAWDRSGAGFSKLYSEPCYQQMLPPDLQSEIHGRRAYSDVAFDGAGQSPVVVRVKNQWTVVAGTSLGSPGWAGILALADQAAHRHLGDVHAAIYRLGLAGTDFRDITSGDVQDPPAIQGSLLPLHASAGWDPATGVGSPDVARLVPDLARPSADSCP